MNLETRLHLYDTDDPARIRVHAYDSGAIAGNVSVTIAQRDVDVTLWVRFKHAERLYEALGHVLGKVAEEVP